MERTKVFLKRKFREYYEKNTLEMPEKFEEREWAFVPLENLPDFTMYRHKSFKTVNEFKSHILNDIPANIYYSSAYYKNPSSERMEDKGWKRADLIFDIDADHLPLRVKSIQNALRHAKEEVFKLLDVLTHDFGINEKKIKVVFSGSRGYHVHVLDKYFQKLDSAERREIIDYLMINDLNFDFHIPDTTVGKKIEKCMKELSKYIMRKGHFESLINKLGFRGNKEELVSILSSGNFNRLSRSKSKKRIFEYLFNKCISKVKINIDAPVTADIKRLIRLPLSLHGKTGLKAMPVPLNKLDEFNPLKDAIAFGDEQVKIRVRGIRKGEISWAMSEVEKIPRKGDRISVPEYLAVFMMCRGMALYGY